MGREKIQNRLETQVKNERRERERDDRRCGGTKKR
jgi:hypothetical protein